MDEQAAVDRVLDGKKKKKKYSVTRQRHIKVRSAGPVFSVPVLS